MAAWRRDDWWSTNSSSSADGSAQPWSSPGWEDASPGQRDRQRDSWGAWEPQTGGWRSSPWSSGSWSSGGRNQITADTASAGTAESACEDADEPAEPWYIDMHDLVLEPARGHCFTLVLLHSCSGGPDDWLPFFHRLDLPFRASIRAVVPCAPIRSEEHYGWCGKQNSWFEYEGNGVKDLQQLFEQRERILRILQEELLRLPNEDPGRLIIGGLSQGVGLAIDVALHAPFVLGGVLALRGAALGESLNDLTLPASTAEQMPKGRDDSTCKARALEIFAVHGKHDNQCPPSEARTSYEALKSYGARVSFEVEPTLGHACARGRQRLNGPELRRVNEFLRRCWGNL
eukprot:gnl/TRDRNA2_/TRDRNA2_129127_c0_seq2.p1 gnl/TRDRNA2_/TRDRNA2_129127_c0~~gnl/TRDRNA2_/TRDRNA2_129127_c0_seq2.p1  ORF type:complete len:344 (-),score=53.65 gnl/TRDRNA2_/TRDRNA2_129127_c0_seq2:41-1072(-)